jgi:hypothetical protein
LIETEEHTIRQLAQAKTNARIIKAVMFEKLPASKVIKKFKISKQKLTSLKSRMKTEEGFAGLLHHKWRLKKFYWDIEKG